MHTHTHTHNLANIAVKFDAVRNKINVALRELFLAIVGSIAQRHIYSV